MHVVVDSVVITNCQCHHMSPSATMLLANHVIVTIADGVIHEVRMGTGVGCMLGAMAAKPKVRKLAQRQQRTKLGVLEKPKEVKNINTEDKQVTYWLCIV